MSSETGPATDTKTNGKETRLSRWLTSALLGIFTIFVAAICIAVLSYTLTQTRLTSLAIDGVSISIRKLDNIGQQWGRLHRQRDTHELNLAAAESKRQALVSPKTAADKTYSAAKDEIEGLLVGFYYRIKDTMPQLAELIHAKGYEDQVGKIRGAKDQILQQHPELDSTIKAIEGAYESYRTARRKRAEADGNIAGPEQEIALLTNAIATVDKKLDKVFDLIKIDLDRNGRLLVENAFYQLNVNDYMDGRDPSISRPRRIMARFQYSMLTTQPDLLTLFLVISMGVLGSALQITHAYFMKNQTNTIGGYFQRVSVGAMTALVIFIIAKAGVPVIADPSLLGGNAPINPYFVSFLAIVSGLLSENAITNIQAQGAKLFGPGNAGPDRWVRGDLTPDLEAQHLSAATLAEHLGVSKAAAESIVKGEEKIDAAQQKITAIYLRREPRDIFTDIPPPTQEKGA
jgi:hypothetical protein